LRSIRRKGERGEAASGKGGGYKKVGPSDMERDIRTIGNRVAQKKGDWGRETDAR